MPLSVEDQWKEINASARTGRRWSLRQQRHISALSHYTRWCWRGNRVDNRTSSLQKTASRFF